MKYIIVYHDPEDLNWKVYSWSHNGVDARRIRDIAIAEHTKERVRLMIEEDHAVADYMQRARAAVPQNSAKQSSTSQSDGGEF